MKKHRLIVFAGLLFFSHILLQAQEKEHRFFIGGSGTLSLISFESTANTTYESDQKYFSYSISPMLGYFISERFMLGGEFEFSNSFNDRMYFYSSTYSYYILREGSIGLNLLVKYHYPVLDKLSFAICTGLGASKYGSSLVDDESSAISMHSYLIENGTLNIKWFVIPELQLYLTEKFGVNLNCDFLTYVYEKEYNIGESAGGTHDFNFSLSPKNWEFGVFYRF